MLQKSIIIAQYIENESCIKMIQKSIIIQENDKLILVWTFISEERSEISIKTPYCKKVAAKEIKKGLV